RGSSLADQVRCLEIAPDVRDDLADGRVVDRLDADDLSLELRVAPGGVLEELELRGGRPEDEDLTRVRERPGHLAVVVLILRRPAPVVRAHPPAERRCGA